MSIHETRAGKINCLLIAGGMWHDIDFARLELLKLLAEDDRIRVRVFEDYENLQALQEADFIVSYTCNVVPSARCKVLDLDLAVDGDLMLLDMLQIILLVQLFQI